MMRIILFILALFAPAAALAADDVSLTSEVLVERTRQDSNGQPKVVREKPDVVTPGEKLVFVLGYRNNGSQPAAGFTVTNPIPASVSFTSAEGAGAVVSVDGGKSWGALAALKVALPDGSSRPAAPADVTHVRWSFAQPISAGNGGQLSFRGFVK